VLEKVKRGRKFFLKWYNFSPLAKRRIWGGGGLIFTMW